MKHIFIGSSAIALTISMVSTALAQTPPKDANPNVEEIVVTGTRLQQSGFETPTPVTSLSAEDIAQRAPVSISDVVNQLPEFRVTRTAAGIGRVADQQSGVQSLLDLRGLGAQETLVLINGRRTVGTTAAGTFDTNMIPVGLVDRTDVVTGGASAAYGSDAVAGVTNFVLKDKLEGISGSIQKGETSRWDGGQTVATVAGGFSFANGRGHFVAGGDAAKTDAVGNIYTRDGSEPGLLAVSTAQRAALGLPAQVFTTGTELANVTPGSLITTKTTTGKLYAFDASGNPYLFNQGTVFGTGTTAQMIGSTANYGYNSNAAFKLENANDREVFYGRVSYDITDDITAYVEGNYGHTNLPAQLTAFYTTAFQVPRTSLPASIASLYTGTNVSLGRIDTELGGGNETWQTEDVGRFVIGATANIFDKYKVDGSYEHGRTHQDFHTTGLVTAAFDKAVYGCNGTTTNPNLTSLLAAQAALYEQLTGKSCVPFSPFGVASDSSAAVNYFHNNQRQLTDIGQDAAELSISGSPFALWAGDVSFALGGDWRRDSLLVTPGDQLGVNNLYSVGNFGGYGGSNSVKEGFAEIGVPLLKDLPFAKSLDFNGAMRRTDYKLSGQVTTWKAGGSYEPVDGLRFRATQSRDIRAPSLSDLYFVGGALPTAVTNNIPGTFGYNVSGTTNVNGQGNPSLKPEKADTFTAGVIVEPKSILPHFHMSVDYYNIKVNGAIVRLSTAQTQNVCAALIAAGSKTCPGVTFNSTAGGNGITSLSNMSQNLNSLLVSGMDIELAYSMPVLPMGIPGAFSIRALINHALHDQQVLTSGTFELAGSMNGVPKWSETVSFDYDVDSFGAELQFTGFSSVKYDATTLYTASASQTTTGLVTGPNDPGYLNTNNNSISQSKFAGPFYTNFSAHYDINDNFQVFGVINNVFDVKPPQFVVIAATTGTRELNYDLLGLSVKLGARFKF